MKAVVIREHGDNNQLIFENSFPDPIPGKDDVIIAVKAVSLNYHDIFTRRGMPGIKIPMPCIMGIDFSGEIVELGSHVTGWSIGDRVLVDPLDRVKGGLMGETTHGGMAELCKVPAHQLVRIPEGVSFKEAAILPVAFGTARRLMLTNGNIRAGERVLILGASGGVGVCCTLLALQAKAEVIVCAGSDEKSKRLLDLGAHRAINYRDSDFMAEVFKVYGKPRRRGAGSENGVDMVVNFTGGETWIKSLRCLKPRGRLLTCGATAGYDPKEDIRYIWSFELNIQGSNGWARDDIEALLKMVQEKQLPALIDHVYPLSEAKAAFEALESRNVFGKILLEP